MEYFCYHCPRTCASKAALDNHCWDKRHKPASICIDCGDLFDSAGALEKHTASEHPPSQIELVCDNCHRTFSSMAALDSHCSVKGHQPYLNDFLRQKLGFQAPVLSLECGLCRCQFYDDAGLEQHKADMHQIKCSECPTISTSLTNYLQHLKGKHELACEKCTGTFKSSEALIDHTSQWHEFKCTKCDQIFSSASLLQEHLHPGHLFSCVAGLAGFHALKDLEEHHQVAHRYECNKCDKFFNSMDLLWAHYDSTHIRQRKVCRDFMDPSLDLREHDICFHISRQHIPPPTLVNRSVNDPKPQPTPTTVLARPITASPATIRAILAFEKNMLMLGAERTRRDQEQQAMANSANMEWIRNKAKAMGIDLMSNQTMYPTNQCPKPCESTY
ncbi:uncharacterized protein BP5553_04258 [Venustampulla echinocandica]|uniref:C2H2-type domain-containing protein n=1 Tax=Venustampulla echinocandica TaxID=2656787 RepID=A0A370TWR7_9HELO|nr:uncharacterized protein BP5553_04258 [Venustampulla echinocandica]RDL39918.1 hypothetical protein BP5553_04258 [Venustampulla echinocandica]